MNVASLDLNIGYRASYDYDESLRTRAPGFFPTPDVEVWERLTFAEVDS